jgi:hypothetical protein
VSQSSHPNINTWYRKETERGHKVGSSSYSNLSTAPLIIRDSFSQEEDRKSVIFFNIADLGDKAELLEEFVLPEDVTIMRFLFRINTVTEESTIQSIIDAAVVDLVALIKKSIEGSSSHVRSPE